MDKGRRKAFGSLIFSLGLMAVLIGAMTDIYTSKTGALIMLAIWFIGGAIVRIILVDKKEETLTY